MPSSKEIGKSALTTGLEVLQDVAKGENIKTAAKKRLKENSLAFLDETVSRMSPTTEFKVSGSGKEFLDLAQSYLYLKVKVSKADGSNLDGASKAGFANYPIASLFNQVDVILGGKLISSATNTYILEVLLNYDKEAAESQLGCGLFCKDTPGQMEEMDITADPVLNMGLGTRSEWTKTSKTVELQGRIHSDLFNQEKNYSKRC